MADTRYGRTSLADLLQVQLAALVPVRPGVAGARVDGELGEVALKAVYEDADVALVIGIPRVDHLDKPVL